MEQDNTQQIEQTEPQSQGFDQDAFLQRMNDTIRESLAQQQVQPEPAQQPQPQQEQDQFSNYIQPYVQPIAQQANFAAAAAMDYSKFYTHNKVVKDGEEDIADNTISETMQSEIEKTFENMAKQGRPASREEIRNYLLGREIAKSPTAFVEKATKRKQQQLTKAQQGTDIGNASQVAAFTTDQLQAMSMDQLTKTMENISF